MPSDKEMINNLIDNYTSLQRIKKSDDTEKELDYQIKPIELSRALHFFYLGGHTLWQNQYMRW